MKAAIIRMFPARNFAVGGGWQCLWIFCKKYLFFKTMPRMFQKANTQETP